MMTATPGSGAWCVRNTWAEPNGSGQNAGNARRTRR
jgi:C1A family cysteine protease